ncbi:DNA binding domain protein, excisionase family [Chloroherpeton thalassium ATCC 35110]|uniref:Methyltransferase n=1 Tax=Chloroherpeton thalassium (strain ATCC 35110 / GB-78) TaxID=517418 RepID=B3QXZ0_CHLT3|nr:DNA methyltransferase [Chloroherpeton thalassium]ACF13518.1 DNA binding domain protein, excisionase family [Chloroherpeton thalassium ATCC 35110]
MSIGQYRNRSYLSATEAAQYLNISVSELHRLANANEINARMATSGQMRFSLSDLKDYASRASLAHRPQPASLSRSKITVDEVFIELFNKDSSSLEELADDSIHLMVTSPPYFNAKLYAAEPISGDLGDIHDIDDWFSKIGHVWQEVFRVLQPGRKAFINIMNLPISLEDGKYRTLNLVGRTIDVCEAIGFTFKRDIVWHKTNAVRAHFGTYPYPGGILINNMHEFILEFDKPERRGARKYAHVTKDQREASKLDKEFWLSIKKSDVWVMAPEGSGNNRSHVAPFPYELPMRIIKAFSYVGERILDPFVGSGTTLCAAADLRRNSFGYEINPEIATKTLHHLATRFAEPPGNH